MLNFTSVELCAGAGGQALGLSESFEHLALVEIDPDACETLRLNGKRLGWAPESIHQADLRTWEPPSDLGEVDLLAGGVPCPPFSIAGKQLGHEDERDLFPAIIRLARTLSPRTVLVENVKGLLTRRFDSYRERIEEEFRDLGYEVQWKLLNACDFGVPQLRPRTAMVAVHPEDLRYFAWPEPLGEKAPTVGETLLASMASNGWKGAKAWAKQANQIAPTLVGGSRKHGGPDLGPTRARAAWARLGVDGLGLGNEIPDASFQGRPKLTVSQTAMLQGFPTDWEIYGRKTSAYRQVGNAFPPPVAEALGVAIATAFMAADDAAEEVAGSSQQKRAVA